VVARASLCTAKNCRAIVRVLTEEATQTLSVNCLVQSQARQTAGQRRSGIKAWRLAQEFAQSFGRAALSLGCSMASLGFLFP
jgi:hypothetical protein